MPPLESHSAASMPLVAALEVLRDVRGERVVVTTMGTAREWPKLSSHDLDLHYVPSAMGHAPALALGLALARPERDVLVFNGDGCQLMSLGSLVTIVASGATNLTLIVVDNGIYEVTGGQATAAVGASLDFPALAHAAGFKSVRSYAELATWRQEAAEALVLPGPRFIHWRVAAVGADYHLESPGPIAERLEHFRAALQR